MPDWVRWLDKYDRPRSPLALRLRTVQRLISKELDRTAPRSVSVLSICAGDGRDILDVLAARDDASRVRATLVEIDPRLCLLARGRVCRDEIDGVEVLCADAGASDTYCGIDKADLVILVGVFGNLEPADVGTTIATMPRLCRPQGLVLWARRNESESVAAVRDGFGAAGFAEVYASRFNAVYHIGAHRLVSDPLPPVTRHRIFQFSNGGAGGRPRIEEQA